MEQHPIPRQITTFEFKLIGFMTLKQFMYLVVFFPLAYIIFRLFPIPILNILLAFMSAMFGILLAFLPVNDQPLDVFIKNLFKRLTSPTQFFYKKSNAPISFLVGAISYADPKTITSHIESQGKLSAYLSNTNQTTTSSPETNLKKQGIREILRNQVAIPVSEEKKEEPPAQPEEKPQQAVSAAPVTPQPVIKKPFLTGLIKNNKQIPLPGILIYIKDTNDAPLRLLKTNPHGLFATYNKLPAGEYKVEMKDPRGTFFFDTMKIMLEDTNTKPFEFFSKELL